MFRAHPEREEPGEGNRKCVVSWVGVAPSFEAACKLVELLVVAEGGSPGPLCPRSPAQGPRGCSCQAAGPSEPLSHPWPLPSCQGAGLAPKVLREYWELAGFADGPASPPSRWKLPTSPRVQAFRPQTYQTALARPRSLGTPCPTCPLANKGQGPPWGSSHLHDGNFPGNTHFCS